ncbi:MAG: PQQ-dependent sugar dehydrogenase [Melioribacteraceae bacterium]|nr:PQQ-dependent sugar dehydrogenase [Melioribacteraceae bacterium]MCF8263337.1 PQQ-dependent sugar dehydrogenase [Melioribacteraceae bacterium]MCF8414091.1 PQQ-dependent sugar dehydrogenase [Melioribacteraceae bacterium]MCF8431450.1 PQQ-dependent sugar dehydrogenase [Melioribacteraceae bacterium]
MPNRFTITLLLIAFIGFTNLSCQTNSPLSNYNEYCATCHGDDMNGGNSASLIDGVWAYGSDVESINKNIKDGIELDGMPAFGDVLSQKEINELTQMFIKGEQPQFLQNLSPSEKVETFDYDVSIVEITDDLEEPWGIAFLDASTILVTEKPGPVRIIENGKLREKPIAGTPDVFYHGQGGMLDVSVDPEFAQNQWIYLAYSHEINGKGMTKIIRGKIDNYNWINEELLFEAPSEFYVDTRHHFGSRIVFDSKGHLYFSIGDRGKRNHAQDLTKPNGKVHRIFKDGKIPNDNPFLNVENAIPSIYSYGNRNPQGLAVDPETDLLWATEHGQKGGDELNIIRSGNNYGWDVITYGVNYDGTESTEKRKMPGMEVPILFWRPSIAVCGLDFYYGNLFDKWNGHLLVGALKFEEVRILDIEDERVIHQEILIKDKGRVRDVAVSPDGSIYVVLNSPDKIIRLTPDN